MSKIYFNLREGYWWRKTDKPKLEDRPKPAPKVTKGKTDNG